MTTVLFSVTQEDGDLKCIIDLVQLALQYTVSKFTVSQFYTVLNKSTIIQIDRSVNDNYTVTITLPHHKVGNLQEFMGKRLCAFTLTDSGIVIESVELEAITDCLMFTVLYDFEKFDSIETTVHYT